MNVRQAEAFERVTGAGHALVALTCEHASERLPQGYALEPADAHLTGTHWAFDLGARELTLELASALVAPAVLSRFSRLLVDLNREEHHPDLFRRQAEGREVALNRALSDGERTHRITTYYRPFHAEVDVMLAESSAPLLLSIHSFTPLYEGQVRDVQLAVLFNHEQARAQALGEALRAHGFDVRYNEPWSGQAGLIYSAESHAERLGRVALELEVRQDLACDVAYRSRLVRALAQSLPGLIQS
jgi:predicted N-formylglutamate amidohydrolase